MNSLSEQSHVRIVRSESLGRIILDRPKALNSLTHAMVREIEAALDRFELDPTIAAVMISGSGERGFCAGGDIRMIYESGKGKDGLAIAFWRDEYRLNARISRLRKPYVAIMDGITMGGGVGISAHGRHRVATDRLRFAMPETGIGFFPDVGATWLLSRAPGETGTYLGLTGAIIGASDAIYVGLADRLVPSDRLSALCDGLSSLGANSDSKKIDRAIAALAVDPPRAPLMEQRDVIDRTFSFDTVEQICTALQSAGGEFARQTLETLGSKSPTALKVTLRMLREARGSNSLEVCLNREFAACAAVLAGPDFYEGVRAAVIDKDRNPRWSPASIDDVTNDIVENYFLPGADLPFMGAR